MTATVDQSVEADRLPSPAAVAERLAVPGLDLRTARGVVETRARRWVRHRRITAGSFAAILAVLAAGILVVRDDQGEVVADRDRESTTSTSTSTTAVAEAVTSTMPVTTAAPTTVARPAPTAAPTTATTVPTPVNQPMQLTVTAVTPQVEAGRNAAIQVSWSDPDFADPAGPRIAAVWGDPVVGLPLDIGRAAPCDAPGAGSTGNRLLEFRFSTPGTYTVNIEVSGCGGQGAFGEARTYTTQIRVTDPVGAEVITAFMPAGGRSPDPARAQRFRPGPGGNEQTGDARAPDLAQVGLGTYSGPATVLRFADVADGDVVQLRWDDGTCAWGTVSGATALLDTSKGCYEPATGTTTLPPP